MTKILNNGSVTVLGGGAFGTAVATLLAQNSYKVKLWCYEPGVSEQINKDHENRCYFSGIKLDSKIQATSDLKNALRDSEWIFEAVPVKFLRNILIQSKEFFTTDQILVLTSKGIEQETLFLPTQIIDEVLGKKIKKAVMAGPNFAKEIAKKFYTVTLVGSEDKEISQRLCNLLSNDFFKAYICDDIIGIQVGGAIKNVIAFAVGLIKGFLPDQNNIVAFILTQGMDEMAKISEYLGGKQQTVYGLSGFGDLALTSTGPSSRNLKAGKLFGQGKSLSEVKAELKVLPEGINTVKSVYQLLEKHNLDLPVCKNTYQVIFKEKPLNDFVKDLVHKD